MHFSRFFRTFAELAVGTGTRVIAAVIPKYLSQRLSKITKNHQKQFFLAKKLLVSKIIPIFALSL